MTHWQQRKRLASIPKTRRCFGNNISLPGNSPSGWPLTNKSFRLVQSPSGAGRSRSPIVTSRERRREAVSVNDHQVEVSRTGFADKLVEARPLCDLTTILEQYLYCLGHSRLA